MEKELLALLKKEAFIREQVQLSSGKMSDYYIDVRRVSLSAQGIFLISSLIWGDIKNEHITAIGGPTLGADPLVSGVCLLAHQEKRNLKGFLIRKSPKKYGRQKLIEGKPLTEGERVVLVDDVATSGASLIKAIDILEAQGVCIVKAMVVVDREEGVKKNMSQRGCPLVSLFTKSDFFLPKER